MDSLGSKHFTLPELCASRVGALHGIENLPPHPALVNLKRLAEGLEVIREKAAGGTPIRIHSGYRCFELNRLVGGSPNSNHLFGLAADFHSTKIPTTTLFDLIRRLGEGHDITDLAWDECLHEVHGSTEWIHFAAPADPSAPLMKTLVGVRNSKTRRMEWRTPDPLPAEVSVAG